MSAVIAGVALNVNKKLPYSLMAIKGIGLSRAKLICKSLQLEETRPLSQLNEDERRSISDFITKEYKELIGNNLVKMEQERIQFWISLGNYKGLRHRKRMPVRGQRTSSNAKTRRAKAGGKSSQGKKTKK